MILGEPIPGWEMGYQGIPTAHGVPCFAGVSGLPMPQLPRLLRPCSCQLGRSAMRLVTLQQCGKCPPASPVTLCGEERLGQWGLACC